MTMNCPKNGMLITALVYAKNATKATAEVIYSTASGRKNRPLYCRRLLKVSQVTAQQNSYSSQPVVASSQVTAQHYKQKCRAKSETNLLGYRFFVFSKCRFYGRFAASRSSPLKPYSRTVANCIRQLEQTQPLVSFTDTGILFVSSPIHSHYITV